MYAEVMIATNTFFNYTVLAFANRIGWIENQKRYLLLSAFVAGVLTVLFAHHVMTLLLTFFLMLGIAFWKKRTQMLKAMSLTLLATLFAGGLLTAIAPMYEKTGQTFMLINYGLIAIGGLYLLSKHVLRVHISQTERNLVFASDLHLFGQQKELQLFIDSGNVCREPLSNEPVHFLSGDAVKDIIPPVLYQFIESWDSQDYQGLDGLPKEYAAMVRLIPIATIQKEKAWVIGIRFEQWMIGEERLPKGYIVLTKGKEKFPHEADGILHSSSYYHLKKRSVK